MNLIKKISFIFRVDNDKAVDQGPTVRDQNVAMQMLGIGKKNSINEQIPFFIIFNQILYDYIFSFIIKLKKNHFCLL